MFVYIYTMNNEQHITAMDFTNEPTFALLDMYGRLQTKLGKGNATADDRESMNAIMDVLESRSIARRMSTTDLNKIDKMRRVTKLMTNVPIGTRFEIYTIALGGNKRVVATGDVVGHTKSGNVKLKCDHGWTYKTKYHYQMTDKTFRFNLSDSITRIVEFH